MSIISNSNGTTTAFTVTADTTGSLKLQTGNTSLVTAVTVDPSQNVGIGITTPMARLNIFDNTGGDALRITQTGTGNVLVVEDETNPDSTPFVIDNAGNVGVGITIPAAKLNIVNSTSSDALRITQTGTGNSLVVEDSANPDSTPFVIDNAGNVGVGISTPIYPLDIFNTGALVTRQYSNTSVTSILANYSTDTTGSITQFYKYRGDTSVPTSVASGDITGRIVFYGYDGTTLQPTSEIRSVVDATPGSADMPGRLAFYTTTDGTNTLTERARIDNAGNFLIGTTVSFGNSLANVAQGVVASSVGATLPFFQTYNTNAGSNLKTWRWGGDSSGNMIFATVNDAYSSATERTRIDSVGNIQVSTGAIMPYAPAPTAISALATLTNAQIQGQIINTTGTSFTLTMPLGTTLETLASWSTTNIAYDFYIVNTATGTITMAVNTGVTSVGTLTVATGVSAQFRIRRTAANTFVLYRLG